MQTAHSPTRPRAIAHKMTELGRLRIGDREPNSKGNGTHPHKLDVFRLTSPNSPLLHFASSLYGGAVHPWAGEGAPKDEHGRPTQFELYTTVNSLDVLIPTFSAVQVSFERWSAGGCQLRCTGEFITHAPLDESRVGLECQCPADDQERGRLATLGKACARILRLNVILPDLPGMGSWRLETRGFYATAELMGTLDMLQMAGQEHQIIEAVLRLEQRQVKRPGKGEGTGTLKFVVPCLWPKFTPRQLLATAAQSGALLMAPPAQLPAAVSAAQATDEVFGDGAGDVFRTAPVIDGDDQRGSTPQTPPGLQAETGEVIEHGETPPGPAHVVGDPGANQGHVYLSAWRDTLEAHKDDTRLQEGLRAKMKLALNPGSKTSDAKGLALAGAVLDCLHALEEDTQTASRIATVTSEVVEDSQESDDAQAPRERLGKMQDRLGWTTAEIKAWENKQARRFRKTFGDLPDDTITSLIAELEQQTSLASGTPPDDLPAGNPDSPLVQGEDEGLGGFDPEASAVLDRELDQEP